MSETPQILLAHHLKALKLPSFLREYEKLARQCAADGVDHVRYLQRLAELELIERERRMVERRIREARFPAVKSLDSFEFAAIPLLNKTLVLELARGDYVVRRENVIAVGNNDPDSYCPSGDLLIMPSLFAADLETAGAVLGVHRRPAGRDRAEDRCCG
jgi:DNA replication protein DnaC